MTLGEKVRYLREVEGALRGYDRELTQLELIQAIRDELGKSISQAYLSQIERGVRKHLTDHTRMLLAKFFKVHPGYLVNDPEGYSTELISDLTAAEDTLDLWLINGAERFSRDPQISKALVALANNKDSRKCLVLLHAILEIPDLADRLMQALHLTSPAGKGGRRK
jgi:transcriptional regulator with XRE-family HTH domain